MRKNTMEKLVAYLNSVDSTDPEFLTMRDEIVGSFAKDVEKARENRELYDLAHDAVIDFLNGCDAPVTLAGIMEGAELPEGFTRGKLSYALRNYWNDVSVNPNGRVNTYFLQ